MSVLDGSGCPRGHAWSRQIVGGLRVAETRQAKGVESRRETTNDDRAVTKRREMLVRIRGESRH
jgi:hypothetical protein